MRDHPRVRGEKLELDKRSIAAIGSPPRARGKVGFYYSRSTRGRITPACAGKRHDNIASFVDEWDHPRVRGEKYMLRICSPQ